MTDCLPQETYSFYVDGELSGEEVRGVESHLVGCERCRGMILALRDEADVIADSLLDRHHKVILRAPARDRAKGLAIGLVPTLGIAALVVTVVGWLMETRLPSGTSWLNPMELIGVYEMTFDMIFMLRDRAPALFEFTIVLGAMVSVASLLTFLVSALSRRFIGTVALLGFVSASLVANPESATAFDVMNSEGDILIAASETIDDGLFVSGEVITIDGTIDGDLIALGERVLIRGTVRGNVFTVARELEIFGTIEGSLHTAAERVTIEGEVRQDVYGAGETITLHERGQIGRDALFYGDSINLDGRMGRDLFSRGRRIEVRGHIGRDVTTQSERLTLHETASIGGDVLYHIREGNEPDISPGAQIVGEVTTGMLVHPIRGSGNRWLDGHFYMRIVVFLVSAFLVGMLLNMLLPDLFISDLETPADFFRSLGFGALALIGTPIALVLCAITIVGIPIAVIGIFLYLTTLFVSVIVVSSLIGTSVTASLGYEREDAHGFGLSLLVGLVLVVIGMNLPFFGGLLRALVVVTGLGMLVGAALEAWRGRGQDAYGI